MQRFNYNIKKYLNIIGINENAISDITDDKNLAICKKRYIDSVAYLNIAAPYIHCFLVRMSVCYTYSLPTMAVDGKGNIYINPEFGAQQLTAKEFLGVLIHETFHILNNTFERLGNRDMKIWNIATDFIMNRDILADGYDLPAAGCIPVDNKVTIPFIKDPRTGMPFECDIKNRSAEYLYDEIVRCLPKDGDGDGEGEKDKGEEGDKGKGGSISKKLSDMNPDDMLSPGEEPSKGEIIDGVPNQNVPDMDRAADEARQRLEREKASETQGRDLGGHGLRQVVQDIITPGIDWKNILKDLVRKIAAESTWSKPNKRYLPGGVYLPRTSTAETIRNIAICIDTSGSISDAKLAQFFAELKNLINQFKNIKFTVILWSEHPYYHTVMDRFNKNSILNTVRSNVQQGGNSWNNFWEYFTKNNIDKNLYGIVHLTDGYLFGNPPRTKIPKDVKMLFLVDNREGVNFLKQEIAPLEPNWKIFRIKI